MYLRTTDFQICFLIISILIFNCNALDGYLCSVCHLIIYIQLKGNVESSRPKGFEFDAVSIARIRCQLSNFSNCILVITPDVMTCNTAVDADGLIRLTVAGKRHGSVFIGTGKLISRDFKLYFFFQSRSIFCRCRQVQITGAAGRDIRNRERSRFCIKAAWRIGRRGPCHILRFAAFIHSFKLQHVSGFRYDLPIDHSSVFALDRIQFYRIFYRDFIDRCCICCLGRLISECTLVTDDLDLRSSFHIGRFRPLHLFPIHENTRLKSFIHRGRYDIYLADILRNQQRICLCILAEYRI